MIDTNRDPRRRWQAAVQTVLAWPPLDDEAEDGTAALAQAAKLEASTTAEKSTPPARAEHAEYTSDGWK